MSVRDASGAPRTAPLWPLWATRLAVSVYFMLFGVLFSTWVTFIPTVQQRFSLTTDQLGLLLLVSSLGSVCGTTLGGTLIGAGARTRWLTLVASLMFCCALLGLLYAPRVAFLAGALALWGLSAGLTDVGMNTQGGYVEARAGVPIMSTLHGLFNVGGFINAALISAVVARGVGIPTYGLYVFGVMVLASIAGVFLLLPDPAPKRRIDGTADDAPRVPLWAMLNGPLLVLGGIAFLGLLTEAIAADWNGVYLSQQLNADAAGVARGYAVFTLLMGIGRLSGDWLVMRLGQVRLILASGALMLVGTVLVVFAPTFWVAVAGFSVIGLGIANLFPLAISLAGRVSDEADTGRAMSVVITAGYIAFPVAGPLVGYTARLFNLPTAMALAGVCGVGVLLLAARTTAKLKAGSSGAA